MHKAQKLIIKSAEFCGFHVDGVLESPLDSAPSHTDLEFEFCLSNPYFEGGLRVNKNDLIAAVSDGAGLSKADAGKAVDSVFDSITGSLKAGTEVRLVGFGTFSVTRRQASQGRNPRTGEPIQIPASNQPKFKAGKGLKDSVN